MSRIYSRKLVEILALVGYYVACISSYQSFGTTCLSHFSMVKQSQKNRRIYVHCFGSYKEGHRHVKG